MKRREGFPSSPENVCKDMLPLRFPSFRDTQYKTLVGFAEEVRIGIYALVSDDAVDKISRRNREDIGQQFYNHTPLGRSLKCTKRSSGPVLNSS